MPVTVAAKASLSTALSTALNTALNTRLPVVKSHSHLSPVNQLKLDSKNEPRWTKATFRHHEVRQTQKKKAAPRLNQVSKTQCTAWYLLRILHRVAYNSLSKHGEMILLCINIVVQGESASALCRRGQKQAESQRPRRSEASEIDGVWKEAIMQNTSTTINLCSSSSAAPITLQTISVLRLPTLLRPGLPSAKETFPQILL